MPWQPLLSKNHGCWMRIQAGNGREEKCGRLSYMISEYIIEGSLEVKLPTIWTDEKQSRAEAERRERLEERRVEEKESEKMQMREKVGKSRNTVFFQ